MTTSRSKLRLRDDGRSLLDQVGDILVSCPRCGGVAHVRPLGPPPARPRPAAVVAFLPRQLSCRGCVYRAEWRSNKIAFDRFAGGHARDPYFGLPLALQVRTRNGVFYAYNLDHLDWIERYVAAGLRERPLAAGPKNRSIGSRLPRWMKVAHNRGEALRAAARIRRRLAG